MENNMYFLEMLFEKINSMETKQIVLLVLELTARGKVRNPGILNSLGFSRIPLDSLGFFGILRDS
jgi:hypothetical protein